MSCELTLLNAMADKDFDLALQRHRDWGLRWVDIKDSIYGKALAELDMDTAQRVRTSVISYELDIYCYSSLIMLGDVARGEAYFREAHLAKLDHAIALAQILKPKLFRLIAAVWKDKPRDGGAMTAVAQDYPWLIDCYGEAIDRLSAAGFAVTIENEAPNCILSTAADILTFFDLLDRRGMVGLTWDIQNQWACGVFPTLAEYEQLRPLIQYVHVKGGQFEDRRSKALRWNVALEDADWPVRDIVAAVARDGVSPVLCLNAPSHGQPKPGYDLGGVTKRDLDFLRTIDGVI